MSIAAVKKISLFGLLADKRDILSGLQALGCMHLLALNQSATDADRHSSPRAQDAYKALHFLTQVPQKRRQVVRDKTFDVDKLVSQTLTLKQRLREQRDRRDFLKHRIATIEPWGDLNFPPKHTLAGYRLWFYVLPLHKLSALKKVETPWQILRKDNRFAYVVLIAKQEPPANILPVPRSHTGALPLTELREQLNDVEVELEELLAERQALTRYIYLLNVNLAQADNRAALAHAATQTRDESTIVVVQGWVPQTAVDKVQAFADKRDLAYLIEEPAENETVPTLIEQPASMQAGVDLTGFYQVPHYRSWDPTRFLFASFSLFFAMILADAGYGLVFLLLLLLFWRSLSHSRRGRAYRLLGLSLSLCTLVYGVLTGSYFGIEPQPDTLIAKLQLLHLNDFDTMMKVSISIGVLHIAIANAMLAHVNRTNTIALSYLGWMLISVGGLLYWLSIEAQSGWSTACTLLIGAGVSGVVLFSSERRVQTPRDYLWRVLEGIFNLKALLKLFGDVLSYMRLFALGLASASLAVTFNSLAHDAMQAMPGLGLLIGLLILLIGHILNLGLSLVSGIVHGLRLNFIEFYNWGQPREGVPFETFAQKEVKR